MINFIVSGVVPGTHVEITFLLWQLSILAIVGYVGVRVARSFKRAEAANDDEQTTQAA
jgi:hypothetical protein